MASLTDNIKLTENPTPTVDINAAIASGGLTTPVAPSPVQTPAPTPVAPVASTPNSNVSIVDALNQGGQPSDYASRAKLAGEQGITNYTGTGDQNTELLKRYKQGFANVKASGVPSPTDSGQARIGVSNNTPPAQEQGYQPAPEVTQGIDDSLSTYTKAVADYLHPETQRTSLVDEYKSLSKDLGIDTLNAQLLDAKRIMSGTEDDIRKEITAAGGFATESQVQGLTIARNKSLLKNAQFLTDQLSAAKDSLNTMTTLSGQDRTFAENKMKTGLDLLGKMTELQQTMKKATVDNYNAVVKQAGYDGLMSMTKNDPHAIELVEKSLGLASGGLSQLATMSANERARSTEKENLQNEVLRSNLKTDLLQRAKITTDINKTNAEIKAAQNDFDSGVLSDKELKTLDASPQGTKVKALGELKQKVENYQSLVKQYGTSSYGVQKSTLNSAFADLKIAYKEAAKLGALTGPDVALVEEGLKPATFANPLSQLYGKISGNGVNSVNASINQALNVINTSAASNINQLYARNSNFKKSDYVSTLVSPLLIEVTDTSNLESAKEGQILRLPDNSIVQKQKDGTFKELNN